jgi:hypothetical protein
MTRQYFAEQCAEAGERMTAVLFQYPRPVGVSVLFGLVASVMTVNGISRDKAIAAIDSALEDMKNAADAALISSRPPQ